VSADGGVVERALRQGFVVSRVQLRACGLPDAVARRRVRRRIWSVAGRGVVALIPPSRDTDLAVAATAAAFSRAGQVVSHRSAAVLHGLPVVIRPGRPELTTLVRVALGTRRAALIRGAALDEDEVVAWYGVPVTTVTRTITDLARSDRAAGLVAADAALRERLVTAPALVDAARRCAGWPGARAARDVAGSASPLAESPLESLTRLGLLDAGLPEPELQVRIVDPADGWWCRVDMLWREQRVVLEADGKVKYTDSELWREKRRQHRLERLGYRVVRAIWADVRPNADELAARVRRYLASPPV
jgi:hypothetical protein